MNSPRVALFPCAYNEVDGVANTMRHFKEFAKRNHLPLLILHGGLGHTSERDGSVRRIEFQRRWPKFRLDAKHDFDLNFWRYLSRAEAAVRDFGADLVHITGPSDVGQLGALVAHRLHIPLFASWHTNVHQYAEMRFNPFVRFLPGSSRKMVGEQVRKCSLRLSARFYRIAQTLFAPNQELISELENLTGKHCYLMSRGVDTDLFHPMPRDRRDSKFVIGYVGRLTTEKNVRFLEELEAGLMARRGRDFKIVIVGQGAEEGWLRTHLHNAEFLGVLRGEDLPHAYASFDVFAFPSQTDTFGNVVLEALAAGVPAVVTRDGGPKYIVENGISGFVATSKAEFIGYVDKLRSCPDLRGQMNQAARKRALLSSWDSVFGSVYDVYDKAAQQTRVTTRLVPRLQRA
jgi:phosphatidylinositol alpha 1,6-mannosyltransferase